jgi:DNA end-binding protein Ku
VASEPASFTNMSRVIWKGAVSFSLIHIPVSLHAASRERGLDFDLLDRRDFAPVGYQRVNKATNEVVEWADIVKGYQYEKGEYAVMSDEDFRQANVEATQTIDIQGFVEPAAIQPAYFERPYYLSTEKRGEKVYTLLREALAKSKTVAIGLIVIRTRQYVCALLPAGNTLLLNTLRYADELLPPERFAPAATTLEKAKVSQREFGMAVKLIEDMRQEWEPANFKDTYREDLLRLIDQKVKQGKTRSLTPAADKTRARRTAEVVDLGELLKRSLAERKGDGPATTRARAPRARSPASRAANGRRARRRA